MAKLSWAETVRQVHQRANFRCDYCQTPQLATGQAMHVEHIIPDGGDNLINLCLACPSCNLSKAQAISAPDPISGDIVSLFNARQQQWSDHYEWREGGKIVAGKTSIGRATISRLKMNPLRVVEARNIWILAGIHPP